MTDEFLPKSDSDRRNISTLNSIWGNLPETKPVEPQTQDMPVDIKPGVKPK